MIHRRSHAENADLTVRQTVAVLRRDRRSADQTAFRILHQIVEEELGRLLHHGVGLREEAPVWIELVVLPEMLHEPRRACWPETRARQITR